MARVRVISASEALFVSTSPATGTQTGIYQLHRVQSCTHGFNVARQNISQFGALAPLSREINEAPTVTLDFSYYLTNALNEYRLGFVVDGTTSAISRLLDKTEDEKNYYLAQSDQGVDAIGDTTTTRQVIGIGNGFLSSYSTEAAVNGFPTSTVRVEALNIASYVSSTGQRTPAVNPTDGSQLNFIWTLPTAISGVVGQVPVIKHGDITMSLASAVVGVDINDVKIQRYALAFNLARESLNKLGSKFAFAKELTFPIAVTLTVDVNVGDLISGSLADILCNDTFYNLGVDLRKPVCTGTGPLAIHFDVKNAKLDSQNYNSTIGPAKTATLVWGATIGASNDTLNGLFMSGTLT